MLTMLALTQADATGAPPGLRQAQRLSDHSFARHSQQRQASSTGAQVLRTDFAAFRERNPSSSLDDRGHHAVPSHPKITLNGDGNLRGWRAGGHSQPQGFIVGGWGWGGAGLRRTCWLRRMDVPSASARHLPHKLNLQRYPRLYSASHADKSNAQPQPKPSTAA